jgi:hypothetical protein
VKRPSSKRRLTGYETIILPKMDIAIRADFMFNQLEVLT